MCGLFSFPKGFFIMPIITNTDLQATVDKLARWAMESVGDGSFGSSFTAGIATANSHVMSGAGSLFTYFGPGGTCTDGDVVADLLPAARNLDESNPTPPTRFLVQSAGVAAFLSALDANIKRYNPATTTLDAYLSSLNATTPTLRVHQAFYDHLKSMSRSNVFVGADTVLATFAATGATSGTYTHVAALPSYVAGAKIVVKNSGSVTTGATLTVTGKKADNTTQVLTATIATGTTGTETDLSVTTKLFVDVTAVTITGGTNANTYSIVAKTDRSITSA
jgi:hypothetical protein